MNYPARIVHGDFVLFEKKDIRTFVCIQLRFRSESVCAEQDIITDFIHIIHARIIISNIITESITMEDSCFFIDAKLRPKKGWHIEPSLSQSDGRTKPRHHLSKSSFFSSFRRFLPAVAGKCWNTSPEPSPTLIPASKFIYCGDRFLYIERKENGRQGGCREINATMQLYTYNVAIYIKKSLSG